VPLPIKRQNPLTGEIETVYTTIRGELDEKSLAEIARVTGGAFFRATDARTMQDVLSRIDTLEKTRLTAPKSEKIEELYGEPLSLALGVLALALLAGETVFMRVPA
jgi:Ca-activated chloride channel family protein